MVSQAVEIAQNDSAIRRLAVAEKANRSGEFRMRYASG
jgi:hypothetical protein